MEKEDELPYIGCWLDHEKDGQADSEYVHEHRVMLQEDD